MNPTQEEHDRMVDHPDHCACIRCGAELDQTRIGQAKALPDLQLPEVGR